MGKASAGLGSLASTPVEEETASKQGRAGMLPDEAAESASRGADTASRAAESVSRAAESVSQAAEDAEAADGTKEPTAASGAASKPLTKDEQIAALQNALAVFL